LIGSARPALDLFLREQTDRRAGEDGHQDRIRLRTSMADTPADEKAARGMFLASNRLHDIVASVRSAFGGVQLKFAIASAVLDLTLDPRKHLDESAITGLLSDTFVRFQIAQA
jgi:hypothetical protein